VYLQLVTATTGLSSLEAAQILGVSVDTLRFYERSGLLSRVTRSENGHRRFSEETMTWLRFVLHLRKTGMPLTLIRQYGQLALQGNHTAPERRTILEEQLQSITQQMDQLEVARGLIQQKLEYYDCLEQVPEKKRGSK
jgi:MerR family transcriptional regulator, aldehyde-responsive regulator